MPLFKFRVYWEDDDNIYRDIVLKTGQTFHAFHEAILTAFEFDKKHKASFFTSNEIWSRGREISSEVLVNKKDAPALSMIKTPVSALVEKPDQKFVYTYDPVKKWNFQIELIGIEKEEDSKKEYPLCTKKEGVAPAQTGIKGLANERLMEIEEKYDLSKEDMAEGFGAEGDDVGSESSEESYGTEAEGSGDDF
ncbi:MAG: hypothetical protein WC756_02500 [Taibaiella sp.]|jgi:hypothetical protein